MFWAMDAVVIPVVGWIVAQSDSDTVDQVESAVESAQVTGWQVLWAIVVLVVAFPVGRLIQRLVRRSMNGLPNASSIPTIIVDDVARVAKWFVWLIALGIALYILGADVGFLSIAAIVTIGICLILPLRQEVAAAKARGETRI